MNKRIYLLLLSFVVIFFSCRDDSGKFEEQLFTDQQISNALKECIMVSVDSACNALCIVDTILFDHGYYYYDTKAYRINIPEIAQAMTDTLIIYGFENQIDTLIIYLNRAAELCGDNIVQFWEDASKEITFQNPNKTLHGGKNAITDYVKEKKQNEFVSKLSSSIYLEQLNKLKALETWNELQQKYFEITEIYVSIDILHFASQQMTDGFFKKMALMEAEIREKQELRGSASSWLYQVFATL